LIKSTWVYVDTHCCCMLHAAAAVSDVTRGDLHPGNELPFAGGTAWMT
jgi:hypothetical protein